MKIESLVVQTPEEIEAFLAAYKLQNPKKFAEKLARGEFKRFGDALPKEENEKIEEKVEEKILLKKSEAKELLEKAGVSFDPEASREELNDLVGLLPQ